MPGTRLGDRNTAVSKSPYCLSVVLCPADRNWVTSNVIVGESGLGSQPGWGSGRALEQVVGGLEGEPIGQDWGPPDGPSRESRPFYNLASWISTLSSESMGTCVPSLSLSTIGPICSVSLLLCGWHPAHDLMLSFIHSWCQRKAVIILKAGTP